MDSEQYIDVFMSPQIDSPAVPHSWGDGLKVAGTFFNAG
jgi:hypothetical protein